MRHFRFLNPGILAAFLVASKIFFLSSEFGYLDDYVFLENSLNQPSALQNLLISVGRPINAFLYLVSFGIARSVANLVFLRLITLISLSAFIYFTYLFLRRHRYLRFHSTVFIFILAGLPALSAFSAWAQHWTTAVSLLLAIFSQSAFERAENSVNQISRYLFILLAVMAAGLSSLIYLPSALVLLTFHWLSSHARGSSLRVFIQGFSLRVAVIYGFAGIALIWGQAIFPSDSDRFRIAENPILKIFWFFRFVIFQALTPWTVNPSLGDLLVLLVLIAAAVFYLRRQSSHLLRRSLCMLLITLLGTSIPNLATSENWASYRSIFGISVAALALGLVITDLPFRNATEVGIRNSSVSLKAIFVSVIAITYFSIWSLMSLNAISSQNAQEYRMLSSLAIESRGYSCISVSVSNWADSKVRPQAYDEFGIYSGSVPIAARSMAALVSGLPMDRVFLSSEISGEYSKESCASILNIDFKEFVR